MIKLDDNIRLLNLCSTKRRPLDLDTMLESFNATKSDFTDIVIYVADDDPCLKDYKVVLDRHNTKHEIGRNRTIVEVMNYFSTELFPDMEYYGDTNDDHVYITEKWDEKLIHLIETKGNGWGCATLNNLANNQKEDNPNASVMSGNIIRILGCFTLPTIKHLGCDIYHKELFKGIDKLFYAPDVIIDHRCFHGQNKRPKDQNWIENYSATNQSQARGIIGAWQNNKKSQDINLVLEHIRNSHKESGT